MFYILQMVVWIKALSAAVPQDKRLYPTVGCITVYIICMCRLSSRALNRFSCSLYMHRNENLCHLHMHQFVSIPTDSRFVRLAPNIDKMAVLSSVTFHTNKSRYLQTHYVTRTGVNLVWSYLPQAHGSN